MLLLYVSRLSLKKKKRRRKDTHHNREEITEKRKNLSVSHQRTDAGRDGVINYSSALITLIVSFRTPNNGTNKMRKQKYNAIKVK